MNLFIFPDNFGKTLPAKSCTD